MENQIELLIQIANTTDLCAGLYADPATAPPRSTKYSDTLTGKNTHRRRPLINKCQADKRICTH